MTTQQFRFKNSACTTTTGPIIITSITYIIAITFIITVMTTVKP